MINRKEVALGVALQNLKRSQSLGLDVRVRVVWVRFLLVLSNRVSSLFYRSLEVLNAIED